MDGVLGARDDVGAHLRLLRFHQLFQLQAGGAQFLCRGFGGGYQLGNIGVAFQHSLDGGAGVVFDGFQVFAVGFRLCKVIVGFEDGVYAREVGFYLRGKVGHVLADDVGLDVEDEVFHDLPPFSIMASASARMDSFISGNVEKTLDVLPSMR